MNESQYTAEQHVETPGDLERLGFSPASIQKLRTLRDRYDPLIEQVESHQQWVQLQFLRWLYRNGIYPRG